MLLRSDGKAYGRYSNAFTKLAFVSYLVFHARAPYATSEASVACVYRLHPVHILSLLWRLVRIRGVEQWQRPQAIDNTPEASLINSEVPPKDMADVEDRSSRLR